MEEDWEGLWDWVRRVADGGKESRAQARARDLVSIPRISR